MLAAFAGGAAMALSLAVHADAMPQNVFNNISLVTADSSTAHVVVTENPSPTLAPEAEASGSAPAPVEVASARVTTTRRATYLAASGPISAVWANTGEDKVTQDELRARAGRASVVNSAWNGRRVTLFGARNEIVAFNLVLEAATAEASGVTVEFDSLVGPGGARIGSKARSKAGVFNWVDHNIEVFFVEYLRIRGLSVLSYGTYDERHVPAKLRRPQGAGSEYAGGWSDRPNHDKFYPDIAVPMEAVREFSIARGQNQSVWVDIYIPKGSPAGNYTGRLLVRQDGKVTYAVPVRLRVHGFTLPDMPSAKTMVATSYSDVARRYTGVEYPNPNTQEDRTTKLVMRRQLMLAHRHKISLIDDNGGAESWTADSPRPGWKAALTGSLFRPSRGYSGPGEGVGNNVFSIGTYGAWQYWWGTPTEAKLQAHLNNWEEWFRRNAPGTDRFIYLIDESTNYSQTQKWANWMRTNPGIGRNIKSFATTDLTKAESLMPSLDISASWIGVADTAAWQRAYAAQKARQKEVFFYNGVRPASGSFAIEDEGVALREVAWGQYKMGIDRWFFWNATYYNDFQGGRGDTNVFTTAQTFGGAPHRDPVLGMVGWNSSNGDGILFYPGIDKKFPAHSKGIRGPIASLRLKFWRRGIQDVDYLTTAARFDPAAVAAIVEKMVPRAMWEVGVEDPSDPTWVLRPISWSIDPDKWEAARRQLAAIIVRGVRAARR